MSQVVEWFAVRRALHARGPASGAGGGGMHEERITGAERQGVIGADGDES